MRQWWWKILGALLLLYTLIVGLGTPLHQGVLRIEPRIVRAGEPATIKVTTYNTTNQKANSLKAWIKVDSIHLLPSTMAQPLDDNHVKYTFEIPPGLPSKDSITNATIIVDNELQGYASLPQGVVIKGGIPNQSIGWQTSGLGDLHKVEAFRFPFRPVLYETIRNTFFHITLWFSMFILLIAALVYSVRYLLKPSLDLDVKAAAFTRVAILFGIMGVITGSIWARFTWGAFWTSDVKLNMSAIAMLIYMAYLILRGSIADVDKRARLSAAYNIFAFVAMIPLLFVIPRLTDSLHPGNGGNPALGGEDMDNTLRMVFYPAIIGYTLIGVWMTSLIVRYEDLKEKWLSK